MSVLFPKVNKAPKWDWRPIYYDPKKDEMDRKLRELQARRKAEEAAQSSAGDVTNPSAVKDNYTPTLHHGSFRENHEAATSMRQKANRQSKLVLWLVVLAMLLFFYFMVDFDSRFFLTL